MEEQREVELMLDGSEGRAEEGEGEAVSAALDRPEEDEAEEKAEEINPASLDHPANMELDDGVDSSSSSDPPPKRQKVNA